MKRLIFPTLLICLVLPLLLQVTPLEILKLKTFDAFIPKQNPTGNFVVLDITEKDLKDLGGWPLPRKDLADLQIKLLEAGSYGQAWAFAFPQPDRMGGDADFAKALSYGPSVLSVFESASSNTFPPTVGTVVLGEDLGNGYEARGVIENIDVLKQNAAQGVASAPTDVDGLVRQIPLLLRTRDGFAPSMALEILKQLTGQDTYIINMTDNEIRIPSLPPISVDPLMRKWVSYVDTEVISLDNLKAAQDKYVIIGSSAGGLGQIATPVGLINSHFLQAALAESILLPNSPRIPDWHLGAEIAIFIIFVLCIWLLTNKLSMSLGLVLTILSFCTLAYSGHWLIQTGILLDVTWTLIGSFIAGSVSYFLRFKEQYKLRQQIRDQFKTYLSPEYVDMIIKDPELMKLGGERKEMSFLFMDIVGFTPISEAHKDNPEDLVDLINNFLDRMTKILLDNGATIDKYMGDCIFVWWNGVIPCEDHRTKALLAGQAIEAEAKLIAKEYQAKGLPQIAVGTGISTGNAIVGGMGSELRMDLSVIGDAVNLGARLEGQTRNYDADTLFPYETIKNVQGMTFHYVDEIQVKGKQEKIEIYTYRS
tara:strand:- start:3444 stop:5219 length:1776 start_codon:yes stop_codon:yes gene_type:complete